LFVWVEEQRDFYTKIDLFGSGLFCDATHGNITVIQLRRILAAMAAAGGYAEFLNGTQLSSQSVSCLFTSLKTERAHLNEAVLVIGSQVCIGGTIDLNG